MTVRRRRRIGSALLFLGAVVGAAIPMPATRGADSKAPETRINPRDGAELVTIPPGEYVASNMHLKTPVTRSLPAYAIYRNPVSVAQYRRFCDPLERVMPKQPDWTEAASLVPREWLKGEAFVPVVGVTWPDAQAYCRPAGARLPTDGEWEKAAWRTRGPEPVAESPYGVRDLRVIVQQWCEFDASEAGSAEVKEAREKDLHSIRGAYGPFDPNPWEHSSMTRGSNGNGFRCVMSR